VQWEPGSLSRLNDPCTGTAAVEGTGCFGVDRTAAMQDINVLMPNELFGERIMLFALKLAKNLRFGGRRLTIGVDVFNVFNSRRHCAISTPPWRRSPVWIHGARRLWN
jgi:hypothetical protein